MIAANVVFAAAFRPVACRPATGVTSAVVGDDLRGRGQPGPDELPAAVVCQSDVDQHQGVARLDDRQGQDTAVDRDHHLRWMGISRTGPPAFRDAQSRDIGVYLFGLPATRRCGPPLLLLSPTVR